MNMNNQFTFVQYNEMDSAIQQLIRESVRMMDFAYCPYSKYKVGAVIETTNGNQYTGCNVENIAYGPTICAERTAIVKAVSNGDQQLSKVAVSGEVEAPNVVSPCGICRQVISEFCPKDDDVAIYLCTPKMDKILITSIKQLLPYSFPQ